MTTTIERRVARLETSTGGGGGFPPCEDCGWGGDAGEPDDDNQDICYEVVWYELNGPGETIEVEDDVCPTCGRRLAYSIYWDDDIRVINSAAFDVR